MLRLRLHGSVSIAVSDGSEIAIPAQKGRALLAILATPLGRARSREEILALLWSDRAEAQGRASLRQLLAQLRKDLGEAARDALRIDGEMISLDPARITIEPGAPGAVFLADTQVRDPAFEDWLRDERTALDARADDPAAPPDDDKTSIAVLPFANLGGDPEQEYFSDGITADIITELSRFHSLFVIAGVSSFAFKGSEADSQEIGRSLDVQYLLQGSVRKAGERIRVTVQLIDTDTGAHLWSERYDRDLTDLFAVQDDIASSVAIMVSGHLTLAGVERAGRKHPRDLNAHDLFMRAETAFYADYTDADHKKLLKKAIELEPTYAEAHARLATLEANRMFFQAGELDDVLPNVLYHGAEAARHAAGDALVHGPLVEAFALVGQHELCAYHLERARASNLNAFTVLAFCAQGMAALGDPRGALDLITRARARDPFNSFSFRENSFDVCFIAGQYEGALAQFVGWPDPPLHLKLARCAALAQAGRVDEARAGVRAFEAIRPPGWKTLNLVRSYDRMCARPEDGARWVEGFRLAGVEV